MGRDPEDRGAKFPIFGPVDGGKDFSLCPSPGSSIQDHLTMTWTKSVRADPSIIKNNATSARPQIISPLVILGMSNMVVYSSLSHVADDNIFIIIVMLA